MYQVKFFEGDYYARQLAANQAGDTVPEVAADTRPPRKRRRRRHGKPLENAEGVTAAQAAAPASAPVVVADNSSFLTRLGRKLKSLVSG